jgi:adenylate cyclase
MSAFLSVPGRKRSLFQKYFTALFLAVSVPLIASGCSDAWFTYRDQRTRLDELLGVEARSAAARIEDFVVGIRNQLGWTVQLPWTEGANEQQNLDASRLLRQVPAIISLTLVDGTGKERLHVSRLGLNRVESGADRSTEPGVVGAAAARVWYGPVTYHRDSEPFMTIAVSGNRKAAGIAIAEINLKNAWDVISSIRVGQTGQAFVLDQEGRLIAHPDISMVLRGADNAASEPLRELQANVAASGGRAAFGKDASGQAVIARMAPVTEADWTVLVDQPTAEAFAPIYTALWRTAMFLLGGIVFAGLLAYWLASRMTGPIRLLEDGAGHIGAGRFDHRITIRTGDEFERLATRFNQMAVDLAVSQERFERITRLKRFLAPQVAELVDRTGDDRVLDGQRREVVAIFGDLRGFTAFSTKAEPDDIMKVLGEYYAALGAVITRYQATVTSFSGDGLMVLVNAPVPCPEPARHAIRLAVEMQEAVQSLIVGWHARGHGLGFGIGLAMGTATVGRIGYENRFDYTAIGSVVNLAARLCAAAADRQILADRTVADEVGGTECLVPAGSLVLKGYDKQVDVFAVQERLRGAVTVPEIPIDGGL